jgi:hypothetical protein
MSRYTIRESPASPPYPAVSRKAINRYLYLARIIAIVSATAMTVLLIDGTISPLDYLIFWGSAAISWVLL